MRDIEKNIEKILMGLPNLFLLLLTLVAIGVIILFSFKSGTNYGIFNPSFINNIVGILAIILTVLILIGFQLMLNVNTAVQKWDEQLKHVKSENEKLNEKIEKLKKDYYLTELSYTKWVMVNFYGFFKNITESYAHIYELLPRDKFSGPNADIVINAFYQSWVFSQNAADMFRPFVDEDHDLLEESFLKVLKAIDFVCNQKTKASCRLIWERIKVSDKILRYLEDTLEDIQKKMGENRRNINCDELDLIKKKISYEQKIREKLNYCYFSNCYR